MDRNEPHFDPAKLIAARRARGLSQRALATLAGISQALVAELERGKHPPSKASLKKIVDSLGIEDSALIG